MRQYLSELKMWKEALDDNSPDPFFTTSISDVWFNDIAPSRAKEYGVVCFQRFGPKGVVAQLLNCGCRLQIGLADPMDTMRDMLGYSVMLGVVLRQLPNSLNINGIFREADVGAMIAAIENNGWHDDVFTRIPSQGLTVVYSTWQQMKSGGV
jgi:hypothetical protein